MSGWATHRVRLAAATGIGEPLEERPVEDVVSARLVLARPEVLPDGAERLGKGGLPREPGGQRQLLLADGLPGGDEDLEERLDRLPLRGRAELPAEEELVLLGEAGGQGSQLVDGQHPALDAVQRLPRVQEITLGRGEHGLHDPGRLVFALPDPGGQWLTRHAQGQVAPQVADVVRIAGFQRARAQPGQRREDLLLVAAGSHQLQPGGQPVDAAGQEAHDGEGSGVALQQGLVQRVDDEHPLAR